MIFISESVALHRIKNLINDGKRLIFFDNYNTEILHILRDRLKKSDFLDIEIWQNIEESEDFDKLENSIKNGSYEVWMWDNYTGFDEYKTGNVTIRDIDSLRCNHSHYLYLGFLILLFTLFSYF